MIKIKNLNKYYNRHRGNEIHVINDTSLEFGNTGLICILGESGSGKTTLLNTLGGLDSYHSGNIVLDDMSMDHYSSRLSDKIRNNKYGYIFQNYYLLTQRSVKENIMLALDMYNISEEEKNNRINYVLKAVGMLKYKKKMVSQLSGGEQQRVAIARALVKSPDVIFADEPTGNLDEKNTIQIMNIIKKISKECLVVLVTHEKEIARFFADRIINIRDGVVVSDALNDIDQTYVLNADDNLYLGEFHHEAFETGKNKINYYYDNFNKDNEGITINIIFRNNKIYINSEGKKLNAVNDDSNIEVHEGVKPVLDSTNIDNFEYNLPKLEVTSHQRLKFIDLWKFAIGNIKAMKTRQIFLIISLLIMSVLVCVTIQDILVVKAINIETIVTSDPHYVTVEIQKNTEMKYDEFESKTKEAYQIIKNANLDGEQYINGSNDFYFFYEGFLQIENTDAMIKKYNFVPLEHFDESTLIYGRMPETKNEVVVDEWVLKAFLAEDNIFARLNQSVKYFLNKEIETRSGAFKIKIVGISKSGAPSIYIDKFKGLGATSWGPNVMDLDSVRTEYPEYVGFYDLSDNKVLLSSSKYAIYPKDYTILGVTYKVVGSFSDEVGYDMIIGTNEYENLIDTMSLYKSTLYFYSDNPESIVEYFADNKEIAALDLRTEVHWTYNEQLAVYKNQTTTKFNGRIIATITILVVSMILLYFAMKSNATRKIYDIAVYRSLGFSKGSLVLIFVIETFLVSCYTTLIGVAGTTIVYSILDALPSLKIANYLTLGTSSLICVCLFVLNISIGILPILSMLRLPPAQLNSKYDL